MARFTVRAGLSRALACTAALATGLLASSMVASSASADAVVYIVNVTVWPGYGFPNADAALTYGYGICQKVGEGRTYGLIMQDVKSDLTTVDEYQASYLIAQAANELCPEQIWALRNSAADYRQPAS